MPLPSFPLPSSPSSCCVHICPRLAGRAPRGGGALLGRRGSCLPRQPPCPAGRPGCGGSGGLPPSFPPSLLASGSSSSAAGTAAAGIPPCHPAARVGWLSEPFLATFHSRHPPFLVHPRCRGPLLCTEPAVARRAPLRERECRHGGKSGFHFEGHFAKREANFYTSSLVALDA